MKKLFISILLTLSLASTAHAALVKYGDTVQDRYGKVISSATVEVVATGTTTAATLYSDSAGSAVKSANGTTLTDTNGYYWFYIPEGRYDITVSKTNFTTQTTTDIYISGATVGTAFYTSSYASLNAAQTAAAAVTGGHVIVDKSGTTLTGNTTVTVPLTVQGGSINQSTYSLTINGPFSAPLAQVFTGSGAVTGLKETRLEWFGPNTTPGTTDNKTIMQSALTSLSSGGKLYIKKDTYYFDITGDSDTLLPLSNTAIEAEPGTIFKWDYWGSPLIAIVNKTDIKIKGIKFEWSGTFGSTSGSSDPFSYGLSIPAYEWCSHIISVGSNNVTLEDLESTGTTTANIQNNFIEFRGDADGTTTSGNIVRNIIVNDVCQGIIWGGQTKFTIENIYSDRYSQSSNGLYGPGHVIYNIAGSGIATSSYGKIHNLVDAGTAIDSYTVGGLSYIFKDIDNVIVDGLVSSRAEGIISFIDVNNSKITNVQYDSTDTTADAVIGAVYVSEPVTSLQNNQFEDWNLRVTTADRALINMGGVTTVTKISNNVFRNIKMIKTINGAAENTGFFSYAGNNGDIDITCTNLGSQTKAMFAFLLASDKNNVTLRVTGSASPAPRVTLGSGTNNVVTAINQANRVTNYANGDTGNILNMAPITNNMIVNLGAGTNPTTTFTLPRAGMYIVNALLESSDYNHALGGLYIIMFDDAATNDFTTVQLLGTQYTKGGSAPSVLGLAVDKDGVVTMTSTAGSNTWLFSYGYMMFSSGR